MVSLRKGIKAVPLTVPQFCAYPEPWPYTIEIIIPERIASQFT